MDVVNKLGGARAVTPPDLSINSFRLRPSTSNLPFTGQVDHHVIIVSYTISTPYYSYLTSHMAPR